ncbi:MAG: DsbA family protein [Kofleriaceae bacterium]|nr:DsbA family protein [Myxococcales bacterium]MCB9565444.1 DsbA family protein [Kofleriaceae bacterium]
MRRWVLGIALLLVAACDESGDVARLEHKLDQLAQRVDEMKAQRDDAIAAERDATQRLDDLTRQVDELRAELRRAPAAPARPSTYGGRPRPDPAATYAVPIFDAPFDGPRDAKVTLVVAGEFACPYCNKARATLAELRRRYPDDLKIVYESFIVHPQTATTPGLAACAAHHQGKYLAMAEQLWDVAFAQRKFDEDTMVELAGAAKLDVGRFRDDLHGSACRDQLARDQQALAKVGVAATPSFFINGRYLSGAQPTDTFAALIDEEARRADAAIASGIRRADYYDHLLSTGLDRFDP